MKHYDTDTDLIVGAGVQAPWPGALYNKPAVVHAHSHRGALRRSYMPEQTLDGVSGHYCGMGSTDSFGMPLAGAIEASDKEGVSLLAWAAGAATVALALYFFMRGKA